MSDDAELKLLLQERERLTDQLMSVNGRAVFALLAITASLLVGIERVNGVLTSSDPARSVFIGGITATVVFLNLAAFFFNHHYTGKIQSLEKKASVLHESLYPSDRKESEFIYEIMPSIANTLAGLGGLILSATLLILLWSLGSSS